MFEGYP